MLKMEKYHLLLEQKAISTNLVYASKEIPLIAMPNKTVSELRMTFHIRLMKLIDTVLCAWHTVKPMLRS